MQGEVEAEAARARPLSGGLWTLFSWLRREERASSSDSLSSAGSARTAVSFAFLPPTYYRSPNPLVLPPQGPPTDSYKKRLQDRNLRRRHEQDLTLHRKYGLHRNEEGCYGVSSLPCPRDRRAASEGVSRRAQHVPGKRRAPLPPPAAPAATLPRRSRKRRAPQPPVITNRHLKENFKSIQLDSITIPKSMTDSRSLPNNDISNDCKSEKYKKRDTSKSTKNKSERSFLKQLFDNRKRNSAIDTSSVKVLPSISELDKQAAEIIESCKQKALARNSLSIVEQRQMISHIHSVPSKGEAWICTRCLRKYDLTVNSCLYCLPDEQNAHAANNSTQTEASSNTSPNRTVDEKQKLKEMLKEIKDSLPKRPKHENNAITLETPTLRIGSSITTENITDAQPLSAGPSKSGEGPKREEPSTSASILSFTKAVIVTKPVVLTSEITQLGGGDKQSDKRKIIMDKQQKHTPINNALYTKKQNEEHLTPNTQIVNEKSKLHTPLKISTLLNPAYIPISSTSSQQFTASQKAMAKSPEKKPNHIEIVTNSNADNKIVSDQHIAENSEKEQLAVGAKVEPVNKTVESIILSSRPLMKDKNSNPTRLASLISCSVKNKTQESSSDIVERLDQHARRRDLVNQLEKSIAGGDEQAAAEAAVKLAQLRLSCSVLSFSSQIVSEPSTSSNLLKTKARETDKCGSPETFKPTATSSHEQRALPVVEPLARVNRIDRDTGSTSKHANPLVSSKNVKPKEIIKRADQEVQTKPSTSKQTPQNNNDDVVSIVIWIEDKDAARGPVNLRIRRRAVMGELRQEAEKTLGLDARLQRWIVGRALCTDDNTPLLSLAGPNLNAPFYLCLVESDTNTEPVLINNVSSNKDIEEKDNNQMDNAGKVYSELMKLEQQAVVPNTETFDCDVCMENCAPNRGVVLRECVHSFCIDCLSDVIRHSDEPVVSCPATTCLGVLQEREIRALVSPEEYERWLARGLAAAESGTRNAFHCRTRDCTGWALCEPGVRQFPCPVCKNTNCVPCQAIHLGETCDQYQARLKETAKSTDASGTDASTRALLDTLIRKGEALECPECSAIITKKWGCDWVKCSACKTEICWVTRGRRWGPNGRGDTSAGCRCGVEGKRCHPSCNYCH